MWGGIRCVFDLVVNISVPTFFVISAFLFYRNDKFDVKRLKRFVKRNILLYLSWLAVLLIPVVYFRGYFSEGFANGIFQMIKNFLFGSTFVASWYIMALIICVVLHFSLRTVLSNKSLLVIGLATWCICAFARFKEINVSYDFMAPIRISVVWPTAIYNSFPAGFLWVCIGEELTHLNYSARNRIVIQKFMATGTILYIAFWIASYLKDNSLLLLFLMKYLTTVFPVILVMIFVLGMDISIKNHIYIRNISTVQYCTHGTIMILLEKCVGKAGYELRSFPISMLKVAIVVLACHLLAFLLIKIRTKIKVIDYML